jgi:hypothetical protein
MRRLGLLLIAAGLAVTAACGDNLTPAAGAADAGADAAVILADATPLDAAAAGRPCLDRPSDLARPPAAALPCELLPPGFAP